MGDMDLGEAALASDLLIVADDPMARTALAMVLAPFDGIGESANVVTTAELDAYVETHSPSVVVWDLGADEARALMHAAEIEHVDAAVVALIPSDELAEDLLRSGAQGVLARGATGPRIRAAVDAARAGLLVLDETFARAVFDAQPMPGRHGQAPPDLTAREKDVLQALALGLPNKLIADRLSISEHTVKFHVNAILGKLSVQSRTEAVVQAVRLGLVIL